MTTFLRSWREFKEYLGGSVVLGLFIIGMYSLITLIKIIQTGEIEWNYLLMALYMIAGYVGYGALYHFGFFWIKNKVVRLIISTIVFIVPLTLLM